MTGLSSAHRFQVRLGRPRPRRRWIAAASATVFAAFATLVAAGETTKLEVGPGPSVMSDEEKAIVPDAASDAEHGVVLLEETERDDDQGTYRVLSYHLRAKILSPEGRALADVSIPMESRQSELETWWGRTILPDGRVLALPQSELKSQSVVKSTWGESRVLKAALPGVVPGSVIDYGYVIQGKGITTLIRYVLQKNWPVKELRYRWVPNGFAPASFVSSHVEGKNVTFARNSGSVLITGHNLLPVRDEPYMPPLNEVLASVTLYYTNSEEREEYWNGRARRIDEGLKSFIGFGGAIKDAIESLGLPPGAPLPEKLQAAYVWIARNIQNTGLRSAEEEEADMSRRDDAYKAKAVLKAKKGSGREIDFLFAGMARALGAEASVIMAVDRTERLWDKRVKSLGQFEYSFVGVRAPGEPDSSRVIVDPGSGLPYGQVPWEATGATGLLCTPKGAEPVTILPTTPAANRADTRVKVAFTADSEVSVKWERTARGASGMDARRRLRRLDLPERKKKLDGMCGGSDAYDVEVADLPQLEDPEAPLRITCDIKMGESAIAEGGERYSFSMKGPWWPEAPEFPAPKRTNPVFLDFPKVDSVSLDVASPPGFSPKTPPASVTFESPFGRYQLLVSSTESGFHVDRTLALRPLLVKVDQYEAFRKFLQDVQAADTTSLPFEHRKAES